MNAKNKFIWVFGENLGATSNNNSYYFWKHVVNIKDNIDKYIVFEKNDSTQKTYDTLSAHEKKFVLWKNTKKHYEKFYDADLFFVTLSYKDITPDKFLIKNMELQLKKPLIYLQHGTIGMKKVYYEGNTYWNNMFRFFIYTDDEFKYLRKHNNFADYQLYNARYHPRYGELLRKDEKYSDKNQILWFITWREYFGNNGATDLFKSHIKSVVESEKLRNYLQDNNTTLKICVHQFFNANTLKDINKYVKKGLVEIVHPGQVDVMDELCKSKLLITDYSSVAYDFTFLNRPSILFQPDIEIYMEEREFYCELEELESFNTSKPQELVDKIVNEDYEINPFFKKSFAQKIDYESIKNDIHIDKIYSDFKNIQENKITFIGMNFYDATSMTNKVMILAEDLLKKEYLVDLISLERPKKLKYKIPYGLNVTSVNIEEDPSRKNKINKKIHKPISSYSHLELDSNKGKLHPYTGYYLNKLMKNIRTNTLISTRESIHLFIDKCKSPYVQNKLFIRNPYDFDGENGLKLMDEVKKIDLDKSIFISPKDISLFEQKTALTVKNPHILKNHFITDNHIYDLIDLNSDLLDENLHPVEIDEDILKEDEELKKEYLPLINSYISKKEKYNGMSLVELNSENMDEIKSIIDFGNYLKDKNIENISLDVFGEGNYSDEFLDLIEENDLFGLIRYRGLYYNPVSCVRRHDFLVSFSKNPRFNTPYLMGVLNYKKVFCQKNEITCELMKDIPNSYIESLDKLTEDINNISDISLKDLRENYITLYNKHYGPEIAEDLLDLI